MDEDKLYAQYLYEVCLFEKYGSKNVITFDEWKLKKSETELTQSTLTKVGRCFMSMD